MDANESERLTLWQRMATRRMLRKAKKRPDQALSPEDWEAYLRMTEGVGRASGWVLRTLPASPRCGICGAPFAGIGGRLVRPLGYRPSRKNPHLCATCVELAPPGGMTMETGVMFADLRGFTRLSEQTAPEQVRPRPSSPELRHARELRVEQPPPLCDRSQELPRGGERIGFGAAPSDTLFPPATDAAEPFFNAPPFRGSNQLTLNWPETPVRSRSDVPPFGRYTR